MTIVFFFFLMIRRPPRSTLSFPTRRSSDLKMIVRLEGPKHGLIYELIDLDAHRATPLGDRKSTRLNSSHVRISYAVFCLKKKKKPITTGSSLRLGYLT